MNKLWHGIMVVTIATGLHIAAVQDAEAGRRGAGIVAGVIIGGLVAGALLSRHHRDRGYYAYGGYETCYRGPRRCRWVRDCWRGRWGRRHCESVRRCWRPRYCD